MLTHGIDYVLEIGDESRSSINNIWIIKVPYRLEAICHDESFL